MEGGTSRNHIDINVRCIISSDGYARQEQGEKRGKEGFSQSFEQSKATRNLFSPFFCLGNFPKRYARSSWYSATRKLNGD